MTLPEGSWCMVCGQQLMLENGPTGDRRKEDRKALPVCVSTKVFPSFSNQYVSFADLEAVGKEVLSLPHSR